MRRFILDSLRRDDTQRCEEFMEVMDDIYGILVTVDFPEGVTGRPEAHYRCHAWCIGEDPRRT